MLGGILLSDRAMYGLVIEEGLKAEDFYRERHRLIYESMLALYRESEPIDVLTVAEHLRSTGKLEEAGGKAAIDELTGGVPGLGGIRRYAQIVREHALMRRLLSTTYEIQASVLNHAAAPRELVEQAERAMLEVAHDDRQKDFRTIDEILHDELKKMEKLSREGTALTGTPSGFRDLDEITGGFQPGNLIVIAARPSMGKCQRDRLLSMTRSPEPGVDSMSWSRCTSRARRSGSRRVGPDLRLRHARVSATFRNGVKPAVPGHDPARPPDRADRQPPVAHARRLEARRRTRARRRGSACPRCLPPPMQTSSCPTTRSCCSPGSSRTAAIIRGTPLFTFAEGSVVGAEMRAAAEEIGARWHARRKSPTSTNFNAYSAATAPPDGNPVTELCRRHGIWGKRSEDKFVPDAIFGLDERAIARFLGILYACDGHIYATDRLRQVGYSTISERLARDVQHLLLRLGIVSCIRTLKRAVYEGTEQGRARGPHHRAGRHRALLQPRRRSRQGAAGRARARRR